MGRDGLTQVWPDSSDLIGANARLHAWVTVAEPSFGASVVAGRDRREPGKQAVVVGGRDARLPRYAVSEQGQAAPVSWDARGALTRGTVGAWVAAGLRAQAAQ